MRLEQIDAAIKEVCPIDGVDSNGGIAFKDDATDEQRVLAMAKMEELLPQIEIGPPNPSALPPIEKLASFLNDNPDVAALVNGTK